MVASAGWYPDPRGAGTGTVRYFDGLAWTDQVAVPAIAARPLKGARYGCPPSGPGHLASPPQRLAARLLDGLILLPVWILLGFLVLLQLLHVVSHVSSSPSNQGPSFADIVTLELSLVVVVVGFGVITFLYEALTTVRWGRSPGKAIMSIRPVGLDGTPLSTGRAFGRAGTIFVSSFINVLQLLDVLWCLWDEDSQCLHDKVCETLVVSDD